MSYPSLARNGPSYPFPSLSLTLHGLNSESKLTAAASHILPYGPTLPDPNPSSPTDPFAIAPQSPDRSAKSPFLPVLQPFPSPPVVTKAAAKKPDPRPSLAQKYRSADIVVLASLAPLKPLSRYKYSGKRTSHCAFVSSCSVPSSQTPGLFFPA